jgi:hypothetical protein
MSARLTPCHVAGLLVVGLGAGVGAEEITLTTYYPSPRGVYYALRVGAGSYPNPTGRLHVVKELDDGDFVLRVDDEPSDASPFVITETGDVGIGTTTPAAKLHVVGDEMIIENSPLDGSADLVFIDTTPGDDPDFEIGSYTNFFSIRTHDTGPIPTTHFVTVTPTGDVGIGTTAPGARLHVEAGTIRLTGAGAPATGGALCLNASGTLSQCTSAVDSAGSCTCP